MTYDIYQVNQEHYAEAAKAFLFQVADLIKQKTVTGQRAIQASDALNIAESYSIKEPGMYWFIALTKSGGSVAGLMKLKTQDTEVKVEDLCANPTMQGTGTELIERAVQFSERMGKNGRLTLTDMSKPREAGGQTFYGKLGFKAPLDDPTSITKNLNPNANLGIWSPVQKKVGNSWKKI
ncbi:N-acetyltransferase [Pseudomonas sp. FW306-02-F02-AA]|uniref:N-acetyltransferase domain-containing protein n=1 Tax=Pseudomonas fluorescens TaxID=294 RepID=A0A0N9W8X6_PSEFL|nr:MULTISPECIES: GNAT family N-acetyltransferase [Pseudomonas]ALI03518.1 hypothetical protein AO353_21520 [Pseudomonas fluorescens]PMZ03452.1 N-acetyltransferase [Pseudomonas sp. FW306-02-F02-AB]PMZ09607.1 N-acetyltransferase [Pseudomonas sp. FW306-02-H06C]PMZ15347.1 N-acetyltransferase [Pseudomonas sp. FW306-02-F02-AA]PMZ21116.1 N-acetyltransferase [Pseudomonas sp. FW306-02-F08-AA]